MKKSLYLSLFLGCTTGTLAACGGGGSSTSPTSMTTTSAPPAVDPNPSFANVVQPIFERNCTNSACHGQATSAGLDLRAGASFGNLVNTPATSEPIVRVIPRNPDGSYLVIKLEGRQTVGTSMPFGLPRLSTTDLTNIRNWIAQGANNN